MMTLFYKIRNGEITNYVSEQTDMGYFGEDEEDFEHIYGYIVIERDDYVFDNLNMFKVVDGELKLKEGNLDKYL